MIFCNLKVIFLFVFFTIATGLDNIQVAKILKYEYTRNDPNSYFYEYETGDGQKKEEKGQNADTSDFVVRGSYSYLGADGIQYTVTYMADRDGFHPAGDHIKVPPFTPWPVNRILRDDPTEEARNPPEIKYLPSSETPPVHIKSIFEEHPVPSSTPKPPLPVVTHTYVPSTPSVVIQGHSEQHGAFENDRNPSLYSDYASVKSVTVSGIPSTAYIPSTPTPRVSAVTVTPISHIASASTTIPVVERQVGTRRGRARNLAAYRKAQRDLFEVIQNNHARQGVFVTDH